MNNEKEICDISYFPEINEISKIIKVSEIPTLIIKKTPFEKYKSKNQTWNNLRPNNMSNDQTNISTNNQSKNLSKNSSKIILAKSDKTCKFIYGTNKNKKIYGEYIKKLYDNLRFVYKFLSNKDIKIKKQDINVFIPNNKCRDGYKLFIDLDNTLIYTLHEHVENGDFYYSLLGKNLTTILRPYARKFLYKMSKYYEIIIFSSGNKKYVNTMRKYLDPNDLYISDSLNINDCLIINNYVIKNLSMINNIDLSKTLIIDNEPVCYSLNIENAIPIIEYKGNNEDDELLYLMPYLIYLRSLNDIRNYNKNKMNLRKIAIK